MAQEQGLSLADIGVPTEQVMIGDKALTITGIAAEDVFALFQRFPGVLGLIDGNGKIADLPPEVLPAVIATGAGSPGDAKAEEVARRLPVETQLDILEAIGRLTFKSGFGPFVERILAVANVAASVSSGKAPDTNSPLESKPLEERPIPQSGN